MTTLSRVCQKYFIAADVCHSPTRITDGFSSAVGIRYGIGGTDIAAWQHGDCAAAIQLANKPARASSRIYGQDMTTLCSNVHFETCAAAAAKYKYFHVNNAPSRSLVFSIGEKS
jgi:hypothetical protein